MIVVNHSGRKLRRLLELQCARAASFSQPNTVRSSIADEVCRGLSQATGISDLKLLDRLKRAGFTAENVHALGLYPIAMAAWASGSVTASERDLAILAIFDYGLVSQPEAISLYMSWLDKQPDRGLWPLWNDYIQQRSLVEEGGSDERARGDVWRRAQRVASASGGLLGFGTICAGERFVLDRIRSKDLGDKSSA